MSTQRYAYRSVMDHAPAPIPARICADDAPAHAAAKLQASAMATLDAMRTLFESDPFTAAIDMIAPAHRIEFYGDVESALTLQEAQWRFARLGYVALAVAEPELQVMSARLLVDDDIVVIMPGSQRVLALARAAETARQSGATVIVVAAPGSPLAASADLMLTLPVIDDSRIEAVSLHRLARLQLIEALSIGVMLRQAARRREVGTGSRRPVQTRRVVVARRGVAEELDLVASSACATSQPNG